MTLNTRDGLVMLQALPLDLKVEMSKRRIAETFEHFGPGQVYVAYSGGKHSVVLSHLCRQVFPDALHLFTHTTNEYPEMARFVKAQMKLFNVEIVRPKDWHFAKVVETYGFPMFSKKIAATLRSIRLTKDPRVWARQLHYLRRFYPKYEKYVGCPLPISERCCDKLKKDPMLRVAHERGLECAIVGNLAEESYMRKEAWLQHGCNFFDAKYPRSWPMAFWTAPDVWEYIRLNGLEVSELYTKHHYQRSGCMFCGFGVHLEGIPNRIQRMAVTHPKAYDFFTRKYAQYFEMCDVEYKV